MHQHAARKAGHNAAKFLLWNEMRERRSKKVQGFIRRRRAALALGARRARGYMCLRQLLGCCWCFWYPLQLLLTQPDGTLFFLIFTYSNLPNNRVGSFNHVGGRILEN